MAQQRGQPWVHAGVSPVRVSAKARVFGRGERPKGHRVYFYQKNKIVGNIFIQVTYI